MFKNPQRITLTVIACCLMISFIACDDRELSPEEESEKASAYVEPEQKAASSEVQIGGVLKTDYFDVKVNNVKTAKSVHIDDIQDLKPEEGNKYLVIDLSLKNTNSESRMMFDGVVMIKANGQTYKYENAETILSDGWGMIMETINPLVTKKTKLVYKIPDELQGTAYYNPARSDEDEVINLGAIN